MSLLLYRLSETFSSPARGSIKVIEALLLEALNKHPQEPGQNRRASLDSISSSDDTHALQRAVRRLVRDNGTPILNSAPSPEASKKAALPTGSHPVPSTQLGSSPSTSNVAPPARPIPFEPENKVLSPTDFFAQPPTVQPDQPLDQPSGLNPQQPYQIQQPYPTRPPSMPSTFATGQPFQHFFDPVFAGTFAYDPDIGSNNGSFGQPIASATSTTFQPPLPIQGEGYSE